MLPEKPDNSLHWRARLEQLESLPGEALGGKPQLWEKLHNRLQETPRRKTSKWYWLAAACLLFIFIMTLIYPGRKQQSLVKSGTTQRPEKTITPQQPAASPKLSNETHPIEKIAARPFTAVKAKALPAKHINPEPSARFRIDTSSEGALISGIIVPAIPDTLLLAYPVPAKKKLRVVHINEIELPAKTDFQNASKNATAVFQIPRLKQPYPGDPELYGNTSEHMLKIKLSPSN